MGIQFVLDMLKVQSSKGNLPIPFPFCGPGIESSTPLPRNKHGAQKSPEEKTPASGVFFLLKAGVQKPLITWKGEP